MKKTLYMIAGSLLLFFVFAYIDEYETLILPLFKEEPKGSNIETNVDFSEEKLAEFLGDFNKQLSAAYTESNPGKAWELPASPELQRSIHDELVYNLNNSVTVKSKVQVLTLLAIETLSSSSRRVTVLEISEGGGDGQNETVVIYIIEKGEKGLLVTAMDSVASPRKRGRGSP